MVLFEWPEGLARVPDPLTAERRFAMPDPLTNGWLQLAIAAGSLLGLICFFIAARSGILRFPKPEWS